MADLCSFRIDIQGLEAFAAFVAVIRGADLTDATLVKLTAQLHESRTALSDAETAADPPRST